MPLYTSGRLGRPAGGAGEGRPLVPRRHHQLGHRVRGAQPAGRLHEDLRFPGLDSGQRDVTVLQQRKEARPPF